MRDLIAKWLPLFFDTDDVFEVRGLDIERPGRKVAGFVLARDVPKVAGKIAALVTRDGSAYFTPQKVSPAVLERSPANHLPEVTEGDDGETRPRLTHDEDVTARRFLIVDVDPVRPAAFKKHSATDAERHAAREVVTAVAACLRGEGWPAPLVVDSGNGVHLYYRLPGAQVGGKADSATDPVAMLLRVLAGKFDTAEATIDPSVYNASRIMKIPGTPARKGPNTAERPHRTSAVIEVPSDW
jgi:hypothetical protein